ncbi:MAG: cyclase family protein [Deltaproteobacteria bacterium]|nr:cyclase family protein [Deltaproteobacteria bacterium]TLN04788.1 MAG: cyclase family protein [bacterium]
MREIIDISVTLSNTMPVWPDSPGFKTVRARSLETGDAVTVTKLECDVHVGTHIDSPSHHIRNGATVEHTNLDVLIGPAIVVHLPESGHITASSLKHQAIPPDARRLLLRTGNSELWKKNQFSQNFQALTPDAAEWLIEHGIKLVGIDYLSIEQFGNQPEVHLLMLRSGVVLLEGLDLSAVSAGSYELICLPIKLAGAEAAPARAVLRRYAEHTKECGREL